MIDYTWVAWFKELTTMIAKAENGERYLADKAGRVEWRDDEDDVPLLQYGDENIDPMSFLYFPCLLHKIPAHTCVRCMKYGVSWPKQRVAHVHCQ